MADKEHEKTQSVCETALAKLQATANDKYKLIHKLCLYLKVCSWFNFVDENIKNMRQDTIAIWNANLQRNVEEEIKKIEKSANHSFRPHRRSYGFFIHLGSIAFMVVTRIVIAMISIQSINKNYIWLRIFSWPYPWFNTCFSIRRGIRRGILSIKFLIVFFFHFSCKASSTL